MCGMLVSCLFLLSSCGIYSKYEAKTAADVPQNLYGDIALQSDTINSLGNMSWRTLFADPQLQQLIDTCLANNTDLEAARLHVDEANAGLTAAKLSYLPSIAFTPNGALSKYGIYPSTGKVYQIPFTASWQIDAFGLLRNRHLATEATRDMLRDVEQATATGLIAGVANVYYTIAMLDEQLAIARETEHTWLESVRTMKALMNAGMSNQAAVSQMEAAASGVRLQILQLEQSRNEVCNSLALLLNRPAGSMAGIKPVLPQSLADAQRVANVGVPCQLLYNRPDVRVAENNLRAACYTYKASISSFFPQITLQGLFGWTNTDGSNIINPAFTIAQLVGSIVQPIFANGGLRAQKISARDELAIAESAFEKKLLEAGVEVNNYLDAYQKAHEQTTVYQQQVDALATAYKATRLTMEHGTTTYLEVLTAQQSLLGARLGQVANRFAETQAVINLYTALGGGKAPLPAKGNAPLPPKGESF